MINEREITMEQLPQVGFMKSFVLFWKNYVNFKGRSRRSEYWYMMLWHLILMVPAVCVLIISLFIFFISIAADRSINSYEYIDDYPYICVYFCL